MEKHVNPTCSSLALERRARRDIFASKLPLTAHRVNSRVAIHMLDCFGVYHPIQSDYLNKINLNIRVK